MIVLILSIIMIGFALLERIIYIKKNKDWNKVRIFIGVLITCLSFVISYLITDTAIGVFYVFLSIILVILVGRINFKSNIEWLRYLLYIVFLPAIVYLWIKATQNILIYPRYVFLLVITINTILSYPYKDKRKNTLKENISFLIGIMITAIFLFSYYKLSGSESRMMIKQELVAEKYLEEELGINGFQVYTDNFNGSLRGEDSIINAVDMSGTFMTMTYKNNEIVSYEMKTNGDFDAKEFGKHIKETNKEEDHDRSSVLGYVNDIEISKEKFEIFKEGNLIVNKDVSEEELLKRYIQYLLIIDKAEEAGLTASKEEVEEYTDKVFHALEKDDKNMKTIKEYIDGMGITMDEYREIVKEDSYKTILTMKLYDKLKMDSDFKDDFNRYKEDLYEDAEIIMNNK